MILFTLITLKRKHHWPLICMICLGIWHWYATITHTFPLRSLLVCFALRESLSGRKPLGYPFCRHIVIIRIVLYRVRILNYCRGTGIKLRNVRSWLARRKVLFISSNHRRYIRTRLRRSLLRVRSGLRMQGNLRICSSLLTNRFRNTKVGKQYSLIRRQKTTLKSRHVLVIR